MPPVFIALLTVIALCAAFWTTRTIPSRGKKWIQRIIAIVVVWLLSGVLAGDPQAAAKSGEYSVYLGIPAVVIYLMLARRAGAGGKRS